MSDILLFLLSVVCGAGAGAVYALLYFLRRTGGIVGTVLSDIFAACVFFAPLFLLALRFNDGRIAFYTVIGQCAGFFAASAPLTALFKKVNFKPRKKKEKKARLKAVDGGKNK